MNKNVKGFKNFSGRMKNYEYTDRHFLKRRTPVIIRLDGKAFHSFTKGLEKPFDDILMETMKETAKRLCEDIQCCKLAYTQSDEISLLLIDYDNIDTEPWFNNCQNKIESVSASLCTLYFNMIFNNKVNKLAPHLKDKMYTATFDSRAFNLPKEEVCNYFIWRQQDATRNSIQMVGQSNFSHKELQHKSCDDIQNMLLLEKDTNWNNLDTPYKRGTCVIRVLTDDNDRLKWSIDNDIPIFSKYRDYIDDLVFGKKEEKYESK